MFLDCRVGSQKNSTFVTAGCHWHCSGLEALLALHRCTVPARMARVPKRPRLEAPKQTNASSSHTAPAPVSADVTMIPALPEAVPPANPPATTTLQPEQPVQMEWEAPLAACLQACFEVRICRK